MVSSLSKVKYAFVSDRLLTKCQINFWQLLPPGKAGQKEDAACCDQCKHWSLPLFSFCTWQNENADKSLCPCHIEFSKRI